MFDLAMGVRKIDKYYERIEVYLPNVLHIIMHAIPSIIPIITFIIGDICKASGIKSKLSIAVISPDAKDNMKLVKYDLKNDSLEEFEEDVYTLCRLIAR